MSIHFKVTISTLILLGMLSACVKTIDIPYPDYEPQMILTGILQPDSILKIRLQESLPIVSKDSVCPAIINAKVACYENGKLVGMMKHVSNGYYSMNYFPKEGLYYKIEAENETTKTMAQDTIPFRSVCTVVLGNLNPNNSNGNPDLLLKMNKSKSGYTWLSPYFRYKRNNKVETDVSVFISSEPFFDTFNSYKEPNGQRAFGNYVRMKPEFGGNLEVNFTVGNQVSVIKEKGDIFYLQVNDLSKNYDRYLKSALVAYENRLTDKNGAIYNPFAEPVPIFSNVQNGVGILAAMQTQRIIIKRIE
jgi:hypothetical protein